MRIAYVINSLEGGGAMSPVPAVTRVLRAAGATVKLFALSRRDGRGAAALDDARLPWAVYPGGKSQHLRAAAWLQGELRRFRPTLLWSSLTQATIISQALGKVLGVPVVSWQHNAYLKPANLRLLKLTERLTTLWVADSDEVGRLTCARLGVEAERMAVWPLFEADAAKPQAPAWRPGEVFRIGSLGRLHPNKGYDILVEALARLEGARSPDWPPFEAAVGGEGDERARLQVLAESRKVAALRLPGFQGDPPNFLASLHGYVQPSRAEGFCIAAHEAMLAGLPAVVSAVGEMPRTVVDGQTGLIVPPGDPGALAEAIAALLDDPAKAHRMGCAARARVLERFGRSRFEAAGRDVLARLARLSSGTGAAGGQ